MKKQKPFFAKFMENQFSNEEAKNVKGGEPIVTQKFPSDQEDNGADVTHGPCNTNGAGNHFGNANNPNCDPIFVTLKFPSDQEDTGGGVII